jgi:hypothetical protein
MITSFIIENRYSVILLVMCENCSNSEVFDQNKCDEFWGIPFNEW